MANINERRIEYTVGYRVDQQSLTSLQQSLAKIKSMTTQDFLKLNPQIDTRVATQKLKEVQLSANAVEKAISAAYNPRLNTTNLSKLNKELKSLNISKIYKDLSMLGAEGNKAFQQFAASAMAANTTLTKTPTIVDKIGDTLKRTLTWNLSSSIINRLTGKFSEAYGYIKNLDSSLNDIRIVTSKSAEEMDKFAEKANKASKALGKSTTDYTRASLIYYQQGLSDEETAARTDVTLKAANVTQQSTAEVSEQLTAVWNGYKVSAQEAELYVDKLAAVAAKTASNLEELSTGMSKVASAANLVGMDVDQMNAALATTISVTKQAPESVGTAYKTILARMTTISAGGTDEDGATLTSYTEDMNTFGINVLDATGHLRDMGDVIEEVGTKWSTMSRESQIALAQIMAGQRQYNNLTALFDNWDRYLDALQTSKTAAGTLEEQQSIYMESVSAHLSQLQTASEGVMDSILDSKTIITFADTLTTVTEKVETIVDSIGNLKGVISGLAALILSVYSKRIGSYLTTSIQNIQKIREEANMLKADMANVKLFAQSEGMNDIATASLVNNVSKLQQYYKVAEEGEINKGKELAKNIAMLESELALHQQNAEASKNYLMSFNMTRQQSNAINRLDFKENTINQAGSEQAQGLLNNVTEKVSTAQTGFGGNTEENVASLVSSYQKLAVAEAEVKKQAKEFNKLTEGTEEYIAVAKKLEQAKQRVAKVTEKIEKETVGEQKKIISVTSAYSAYNQACANNGARSKEASVTKKILVKSIQDEINNLAKVRDSYQEGTEEYEKYAAIIEKVNTLLNDESNKNKDDSYKADAVRGMVSELEEANDALSNTANLSEQASDALSGKMGEAGEQVKASLELTKNEFNDLLETLNMKAIGEGFSAFASGISQCVLVGQTLTSMTEAWNDESLSTEERLSRLTSSVVILMAQIPLMANNFTKVFSSFKTVGQRIKTFITDYAVSTLSIQRNTNAQNENTRAIRIRAAAADLALKRDKLAAAQTELNNYLKDKEAHEIDEVTLATLKQNVATQAASVAEAENTVVLTTWGAALKAALAPIAPIILAVTALTAVIGIVAVAYHKWAEEQMAAQKTLENAQAALENATEAYNNLAGQVSSLASLLEELKKQKDALEELATGTDEWNEALEKVNETTEKLLENFPELYKYATFENGQWVITEEGLETFKQEQNQKLAEAKERKYAAGQVVNIAEGQYFADRNVSSFNFGTSDFTEEVIEKIGKEAIGKSIETFNKEYSNKTGQVSVADLRKIAPYLFEASFDDGETALSGKYLNVLSEAQGSFEAAENYRDARLSYSHGSIDFERFKELEENIPTAFTFEGEDSFLEFLKNISSSLEKDEEIQNENFSLSKAMLASSEKGNEISSQILDSQGRDGEETPESVAMEDAILSLAATRANSEQIKEDIQEIKPDYTALSEEEITEAAKAYAQQLENSGKELLTSLDEITNDNRAIKYKDNNGDVVEVDLTNGKYNNELYEAFLQNEIMKAGEKALEKAAEEVNTIEKASLIQLLANPEKAISNFSKNQTQQAGSFFDGKGSISKELPPETQAWVKQMLALFGISSQEVTENLKAAKNTFSERKDATLSSRKELVVARQMERWDGFDDLSGEQQQQLFNKIHDIWLKGEDQGLDDFLKEANKQDNPIDFTMNFNYEEAYKGLSVELTKRLKTLKIDESTFNNYKEAFKKVNKDIADETVVQWLEAQKDMDKIEKNKNEIFSSLSNIDSNFGLSSTQLENIIQLEDAFEALSGLDLSQDWLLEHLELLKQYIEGSPEATAALNQEFALIRAANDETFNLFEKYKRVLSGKEMEDDLLAALTQMFDGDKEKQDKLAKIYGWVWDEEKQTYIRDTSMVSYYSLISKFSEEGQSTLAQSDIDEISGLLGMTEAEINKKIKQYDPEAEYDESTRTWKLKTIIETQLMSLLINGEDDSSSEVPENPFDNGATEKTYTKIERNTEFDINYDAWDKMISYKQKELDRLEKTADDLTGDALLKNLEERKKVYEEINEQREEELKQNQLDIEKYKKEVESLGAEIDPETGYILNERDIKKGWTDQQNDLAEQYNQYINEDGSLTAAGSALSDDDLNKVKKSYDNFKKTVEENKQAFENYNDAIEKNIELLEDSLDDIKAIAEINATTEIVALTNEYDKYAAEVEAAKEETERFENLLSDDKAVTERIGDLAELGKAQKAELEAYTASLAEAEKERDKMIASFNSKGFNTQLTGNSAKDAFNIQQEISNTTAEIAELESKLVGASEEERAKLEAQLQPLYQKKSYLDQFNTEWENNVKNIDDSKKAIQDMNDALSTSVEEMEELSDWQTGSVDKQLETVERTLSRLQKRESRLTGQNLIANLNKQKAIIQQQIKLEENKLKVLKAQLKTLQQQIREALKRLLLENNIKIGIKFEQDGSVNTTSLWEQLNANKENITDDIRETIVSLVNEINSKTSEINSLEDSIFGHQEDIKDLQDKIKDAVEEAAKKAMDRALEIFNAKVDFEVSIEDAWRQFDRLEAKVNGLREKTTELFQNALLDYSDAIRYVTANINSYFGEAGGGSIQILTQHVNDIMSEIGIMQAGGKSSLYGIDQTTAFSDLENYYGQLMSAVEGFYDAIDSAKEKYSQAIDAIINKNKELLDDFEKIKSLQDHGINLTKLLYGEESFAQQQDYLDKQSEIISKQLEASVKQRDYYAKLLATLNPDDDNYDKVKSAYIEAMEEVYQYTEDKLDKLHESLMNKIDTQKAAIQDELAAAAGFGSNAQADRDWEYQTKLDNEYLDATNTQYEIESLTNKFNDAIAGTDSLAAKEKLTDVMNEQLDILNEQLEKGQKLTKYDVERANKVYELTLKQIALEEAQENKSKMRLRRDSQGNYRYEYVADQDKINQAKQDLLDAENDLYNFDKNRAKEMVNSLNELITEYYEKQKEITEDLELTEEERDAALLELQERYWGKQGLITMAKDEYLQASERTKEESVDNYAGFDKTLAESLTQTWEDTTQTVAANTDALIEDCRNYSQEVRNTMDTTTSGAEDLEDAILADTDAMAGLIEQDEQLIDQYAEQIDAIEELLNELETLEAQYKAVMDAALAAVDAALKLRQTSWETEEDKKEKEKAKENDNDINTNGLSGNGNNNSNETKEKPKQTVAGAYDQDTGELYMSKSTRLSEEDQIKMVKEAKKHLVNSVSWGHTLDMNNKLVDGIKKNIRHMAISFDTGGYTGEWGKEGRMAMLHEKELILNKVDTANILQAVDIVRTLSSDLAALQTMANQNIVSQNINTPNAQNTVEQNVKIEATFPNVTNSNEIQQAFNNLVNLASQRAMRR